MLNLFKWFNRASLIKLFPLLLVVVGYSARLLLMPLTGHNDVLFMPWHAHFVAQGHFNVYDHLLNTYGEHVINMPVWAPYPYGFYAYTGFWAKIYDLFGLIDLNNWPSAWAIEHPMRAVFLFKLLYLPFDILIGWVLKRSIGMSALMMWALSPTAIYMLSMGQNDVYATTSMVLATALVAQSLAANEATIQWQRAWQAMLVLGVGASFKMVPLFLVIPLILLLNISWKRRISLLIIAILPFIILSLPFLSSKAYISGVLFNPEGTRIFDEENLLSEPVSFFLLSYSTLLIFLLNYRRKWVSDSAWWVAVAVMAMFFLWIHIPVYWLYWFTPFAIVIALRFDYRYISIWFLAEFLFIAQIFSKSRDINIGLSRYLANELTFMHPVHALSLRSPLIAQLFNRFEGFIQSFQLALFGFSLALAVYCLYRVRQAYRLPQPKRSLLLLLPIPLVINIGVIIGAMLLTRGMIIPGPAYIEPQLAVKLNQSVPIVTQQFTGTETALTGFAVKLRDTLNTNPAIQGCVTTIKETRCAPLVVPKGDVWEYVGYNIIYPPIPTFAQPYTLTLRLNDPNRQLDLGYRSNRAIFFNYGTDKISGVLPFMPMHELDVAKTFVQLTQHLTNDWLFIGLWMGVYSIIMSGLWRISRSEQPINGE